MQIRTTYEQLQPEDRMTIASMSQQHCSMRAMARMLQRSPSTISREIARNTSCDVAYGSHRAQQSYQARRCAAKPAAKLAIDSVAWGVVLTLLDWRWSPQQIAGSRQGWRRPGLFTVAPNEDPLLAMRSGRKNRQQR